MKRKHLLAAALLLAAFVCAVVYFSPIPLSGAVRAGSRLSVQVYSLRIEGGTPILAPTDYPALTDEQQASIQTLAQRYTYRRTPATPFTDGSLSDLGDKALYLFVYEGDTLTDTVTITASGQISVRDKVYTMPDAPQFITQVEELCAAAA